MTDLNHYVTSSSRQGMSYYNIQFRRYGRQRSSMISVKREITAQDFLHAISIAENILDGLSSADPDSIYTIHEVSEAKVDGQLPVSKGPGLFDELGEPLAW